MKQLYGVSFETIYGKAPAPLWMAELAKLTDDECRAGLSRLASQRKEYPANLSEFLEACKPKQPVRFLGTPTTPAEMKRLEPPRASREVIAKRLASMRRKLGQ